MAIKREMQNGFHPHPPRNLSPNHDFMGVLYTVVVGKAWTMFFFLLVMRARARHLFSQKQFISFLESPISATPLPAPLPEKKYKLKIQKIRKKEERKTNDRLICVEIRFKISCRSIPISKIQVQISQSNTPSLLSLEVSGEFSWQWLLLSLYTLTNFLC